MTRTRALPRSDGEVPVPPVGEIAARAITDRQLEILAQAARGRTNRQIGAALGISERTVRNHMREILKRLSSSDRTHAVVVAIGHGWIAIPIDPEPDRGPLVGERAPAVGSA